MFSPRWAFRLCAFGFLSLTTVHAGASAQKVQTRDSLRVSSLLVVPSATVVHEYAGRPLRDIGAPAWALTRDEFDGLSTRDPVTVGETMPSEGTIITTRKLSIGFRHRVADDSARSFLGYSYDGALATVGRSDSLTLFIRDLAGPSYLPTLQPLSGVRGAWVEVVVDSIIASGNSLRIVAADSGFLDSGLVAKRLDFELTNGVYVDRDADELDRLFTAVRTRGKRDTEPVSIAQYMALTAIVRRNTNGGRVVPFLTAVAQDTTERDMVRATAIDGLRVRGGQARSAVPVLRSLLNDDPLGSAAAAALARIQPDEDAAIALAPWLQHKNREIRILALSGAMYMGPAGKPAAPALAATLLDGKTAVPGLIALGRIGPGAIEAAPQVAGLLNSNDVEVRLIAAVALPRIDASKRALVAQTLADRLLAAKPEEQYPILNILGNLGPEAKATLPVLRQLAETAKYPMLRQATERAIAKLAP